MLCIESLSCRSTLVTYFTISAAYAHYEAVFLCLHPKRLKMSYASVTKYMKKSKIFVSKWVKRYSVKNVDDLSDRGSIQKGRKRRRMILWVFEKNPRLLLCGGQVILYKKDPNISCVNVSWHYKKTFTGSWKIRKNFKAQWRNRYIEKRFTKQKKI